MSAWPDVDPTGTANTARPIIVYITSGAAATALRRVRLYPDDILFVDEPIRPRFNIDKLLVDVVKGIERDERKERARAAGSVQVPVLPRLPYLGPARVAGMDIKRFLPRRT
jgi:hypothetical protein